MENLPPWVTVVMPVIVIVVTFLCRRVPALATYGPRNIGAVISLVIGAIIVIDNPPVVTGAELMEYVASLVAAVLLWWKTAQLVWDAFTGQLASPEKHATP